jgi:hypothetical protein
MLLTGTVPEGALALALLSELDPLLVLPDALLSLEPPKEADAEAPPDALALSPEPAAASGSWAKALDTRVVVTLTQITLARSLRLISRSPTLELARTLSPCAALNQSPPSVAKYWK